jgi:hypothetical protein
MEVRWRQRQWAGYARDAQAALARAAVAQQDPTFCKAVLDLLRTYVESPRPDEMPAAVDEAIARLAIGMHHRLHFMGNWQQMAYLWRHLATFARQLPDATLFAELIKQQALIVSSLGRTQESQRLYQTLVQDATFARLPIRMQADMLVNVGTSALWTGTSALAVDPLLLKNYPPLGITLTIYLHFTCSPLLTYLNRKGGLDPYVEPCYSVCVLK